MKLQYKETATCKLLQIGKYYSLRCGCYETKEEIPSLDKYKNAYIVKTFRSRFITPHKLKPSPNPYNFDPVKLNLTPRISEKQLSKRNKLPLLIKELSSNAQSQAIQIKDTSSLFGLSIQGKYDQYAEQNYLNREYTDYEYNVKLKYNIFKNGYFEQQTRTQENLAQSTVIYYQNLINLQKYNYDTNVNEVDTLLNEINIRYYNALITMYDDAIKRKKNLLENGMETRYALDVLIHKQESYLSLKKAYQEKRKKSFDKKLYKLLLIVENIELIPLQQIEILSKKSNSEILMQNAKSDFFNVQNNPYNDITLNVYSSLRALDEVGSYLTFGAEIDLPLNLSYSQDSRLLALQTQRDSIQKKAVEEHLTRALEHLYRKFYTTKSLISSDKNSIGNFYLELENYKTIAMHKIPSLKINFEQKILATQSDIIELKYRILLKRVDMIKILIRISYLSNIYDIKKLTLEQK